MPLQYGELRPHSSFWATVCKTVRPMLSVRCQSVCPVCLSACNVRALWPNGWMDQDATWSRENSSAQVILWCIGPTSSPKGAQHPHFSTHVYCGQTARWIKMPLVVELGFGPGHIVLSFICNSHVHPQTTAANHRTLAGTQLPPAEGRRLSCPM